MKEEITRIARQMSDRRMLTGSTGNISARAGETRILVTPTGLAKGRLVPDDIVTVDMSGRKIDGPHEATSEMPMHLFVYEQRPDIRACIHTHSPYATAFALAGVELPDNVLPETVLLVGRIPLTEYAPAGTEAVPQAILPFIATHNAFLLRNHGLLTVGRDLEQARNRHETVEHLAQVAYLARQLGGTRPLPAKELKRLENVRRRLDEP